MNSSIAEYKFVVKVRSILADTMSSTGVLFSLVALAFTIKYIRDRVRNAERYRLLNKFKTLPVRRFPLIGHMWYFVGSIQRIFHFIDDALAKVGSPLVVWFGIIPSVHLEKLEDIEYVAKQCLDRNTYGFVTETIGDGIALQNHERWKTTRRLLNPAFGPTMLTQYFRIFDEQSTILVNVLQQKAVEGEPFDIGPFLLNANIDTISENTMGMKPDCQRNQENEYSKALLRVTLASLSRLCNPLLYFEFAFQIYSHLSGLARQIKLTQEYPIEPLRVALKNMDRERNLLSSESRSKISKRMIDVLLVHHLNNPNSISEKQMIQEMNHMTVAGSETMAIAVGFLMLMYGMHPDEQEKVYQEIKTIIPDDRPVAIEDLNQLVYLKQTIKETLRLFSVVPLSFRSPGTSLALPSGDTVPGHVDVFSHFSSVHRNPMYYPNSENWNPENFGAEAIEVRPQNSFLPFGLGPRNCIGYKYAMLSMEVQVCHLLRKYRVSTETKIEDIVMEQDLVCRSRDGYLVRLQIRES